MKYPRHLTGPSSVGAAGVRGLAERGGDWQQTQKAPGVRSFVQGEFKKVIVDDEPEYLASANLDQPETVIQEVKRLGQSFRKSRSKTIGVPLGIGQYLSSATEITTDAPQTFQYLRYTGDTLQSYTFRTISSTQYAQFGTYLSANGAQVIYGSMQYLYITPGITSWILAGPEYAYAGQSETDGKVVVGAVLADVGREDAAGRQLFTPSIIRIPRRDPDASQLIGIDPAGFTRPEAEFCQFIRCINTGRFVLFLAAEHFFWTGNTDPGTDYEPKVWAIRSDAPDMETVTVHDVTAGFPGGFIPIPNGSAPGTYYSALSGNEQNNRISQMMTTMRLVALDDDVLLLFYRQYLIGGQWRLRVARLDVKTMAATVVYTSPDKPSAFVQSAAYLGDGVVIAKRCDNFPGTNRAVDFLRSTDHGATWTAFTPVGLDAPLMNQYLGQLRVHRARKSDEAPGELLMPAWSVSDSAYFVYSSRDSGQTWQKRGLIYRSSVFYRVDTMVADDGGGNFDFLAVGPNPAIALDPALPGRFRSQ